MPRLRELNCGFVFRFVMSRTPYNILITSVVFVAGVVVLHLLHKLF